MEQPNGPTFGEEKAHIYEKRTFNIPVSGVNDVRSSATIVICPDRLYFRFERYYTEGDPKPPWQPSYPTVRGKRRLKDGSLSENSTHERVFHPWDRDKTPFWVAEQVEKYRPPR